MREPLFVYILAGVLATAAIWPLQIAMGWMSADFAIARRMLDLIKGRDDRWLERWQRAQEAMARPPDA